VQFVWLHAKLCPLGCVWESAAILFVFERIHISKTNQVEVELWYGSTYLQVLGFRINFSCWGVWGSVAFTFYIETPGLAPHSRN